jgi:hypothetical protein
LQAEAAAQPRRGTHQHQDAANPRSRCAAVKRRDTGNVVNLMDVLRKSLSSVGKGAAGYSVSFWASWLRLSSRNADLKQRMRRSLAGKSSCSPGRLASPLAQTRMLRAFATQSEQDMENLAAYFASLK